jgi:tRNA nucleotidyltransferase (CCA-adding enzyme)
MEIITSHTHLDLDGFASMILAKKLYPEAILVFSGDLSPNVKSLANLYQDYLDIYKASEIPLNKVKKMIVVDTAKKNRIGKFENLTDKVEIIVYDHHLSAKDDIDANEKYISRTGSNSANMLDIILKKNKNIAFEDYEATIALMGIYEDTGNFVFNNTTKLDMEMAAKLVGYGGKISMVSEYVNKNLKQQELDMLLELIENGEIVEYSDYPVFITTYYSNEYFNGIDVLINKIMELEGAEGCFIIFGTDDRTSIVGRSKNKDIAVDKVLSLYAKGGHKYAGSVNVKGKDIYTIEKEIKEQLEKHVYKGKLAKDIMKSPVKIVDSESRVKDVHKIMFRFGYSGIPIMDGEKLIGIISRRDIDKAINHGFSNAPVRAYMSKTLIIASENTPVKELKNIIIENEIGRVPIVRNGRLVGIVTRTDILRSLYEQKIKKQKGETAKENEIKERILDRIPKHLLYILKNIEEVSEIRNEKAYLVGGIVRDLILGINNLDIDIVVEGDGPLFAEKLADISGAMKVVKHDKFKTAVVVLADGVKIDVASSRVEYYEYPTSMPTVDYGSIKQDLYRRDFSINAMALEVDYHNFGKIIDYYNGYRDLKNRKIRILHNLSFIEDPTRIIRAVRFAARYGFELEEETRGFMVEAVNSGFLEKLSWHRVKNEIVHILKEKNVEKALEILFEFKVISSIHRNIKVDEKMKKDLVELKKERNFVESRGVEMWILYLLILLKNLKKDELDFVFKRFSFGESFIKKYDYGVKMRDEVKKLLKESNKASDIYIALSSISKEVIMLMYIANEELRPKIKLYIDKIRNIERTVKGEDLIEIGYKPSPLFKNYLEELYLLELDLELHDKDKLIALWENSKVEENKKVQAKE